MKTLASTLLFILLCSTYAYQAKGQQLDQRKEQLTEIAEKIKKYYIFEDVANSLSAQVIAAADNGIFANLSNEEFADSLSAFLAKNGNDLHFNVLYRPRDTKQEKPVDEKTLLKEADEINRRWNYGFEKVKRLDGNIGYVQYTGFPQGNKSAEKILDATMNFVSNTNALIIDLRDNRGGDHKMVELFLSYFFPKKIKLSDNYTRYRDRTSKSYTKGKVNGIKYLDRPLYILVDKYTISAAEALAYDLQARRSATIIGEKTYGAANPIEVFFIDNTYALFIPVTTAKNTKTKTNWEHVGVPIDIKMDPEKALLKAHELALEKFLRSNTKTELSTEEIQEKIKALQLSLK